MLLLHILQWQSYICTCTQSLIRKFYLLKNILAYCGYSLTSPFFLLLSEHKHCNNMATNLNSENTRSRMVASLRGNIGTGTKEDESSIGCDWATGFHHVMAHSLLARVLKLTNCYFFNFPNFWGAAVDHGYGGPPVSPEG
jgi:hypothetical protein